MKSGHYGIVVSATQYEGRLANHFATERVIIVVQAGQ